MDKKTRILRVLGIGLILCGTLVFLAEQMRIRYFAQAAETTVELIESLLPERTPGIPEPLTDPAMPVLELEGRDYIALIDVPGYGCSLPVGSQWNKNMTRQYPCRFWGSVNDNTLVIGGSDQHGQFTFLDTIDLGAGITVTDMSGCEFHYCVTRVDRSKQAQSQWLCREEYDLTVFARSSTSLEYIAVRCNMEP